jgi:hypothetical protein
VGRLAALVSAVLIVGLGSSTIAARASTRSALLTALRSE